MLVTGWGWLALAQAVVFAMTALDPRYGPYGYLYRALILPRLGPTTEREDAAPVRFAQLVGFVFLAVASIGYLTGVTPLGIDIRRAGPAGGLPERRVRALRGLRGLPGGPAGHREARGLRTASGGVLARRAA